MRAVRKRYYRLVSRFANISIPPDVGEFQLIDRVVNTITAWAETQHYFATDQDLKTFQADLDKALNAEARPDALGVEVRQGGRTLRRLERGP